MADDDLRFGDIKPGGGSSGNRIEWATQILIQLMIFAVVVYVVVEFLIVMWF